MGSIYTISLLNEDLNYTNFTDTTFQKIPIPHLTRTLPTFHTTRTKEYINVDVISASFFSETLTHFLFTAAMPSYGIMVLLVWSGSVGPSLSLLDPIIHYTRA